MSKIIYLYNEIPVSYTHLDVYKRQSDALTRCNNVNCGLAYLSSIKVLALVPVWLQRQRVLGYFLVVDCSLHTTD